MSPFEMPRFSSSTRLPAWPQGGLATATGLPDCAPSMNGRHEIRRSLVHPVFVAAPVIMRHLVSDCWSWRTPPHDCRRDVVLGKDGDVSTEIYPRRCRRRRHLRRGGQHSWSAAAAPINSSALPAPSAPEVPSSRAAPGPVRMMKRTTSPANGSVMVRCSTKTLE